MDHYTPTEAQLQALLRFASTKLGVSEEQLIASVQNGSALSPENEALIKQFTSDPAKAEQLLSSPAVKELLRRIK